jgi:transcription termination factor Rho
MNYSKMKIDDLKKIAGEKGLRDIEHLKKAELIELLTNVDLMMQKAAEKPAERAEKKSAEKTAESKKSAEKPVKAEKEETMTAEEKPEGEKKPARKKSTEKKSEEDKKPSEKKNAEKQSAEKRTTEDTEKKPARKRSSEKSSGSESQNIKTDSDAQKTENAQRTENVQKTESTQRAEVSQKPEAPSTMQYDGQEYNPTLASGEYAAGILEVMSEGYGFIRSDNYMPGEKDIYISPAQIRKFGLRTGDIIKGPIRTKMGPNEKFRALLFIESVNGMSPAEISRRLHFEDMTPVFPNERIRLDYNNAPVSLRIVDLFSPIGKGQRGMIVSPPKAGKTTLLKQIAKRISVAYPDMNLLVLLIDERPEEVTDIKESIEGPNAEVIYSTFDELPEHHKRVSEMVIERAKRLVESKKDVVILIDSITRLSRAYNLTVAPSGRTLSGGLDPAALHMPKKFFGAARNMREGGSLTILATALIDTGSRMDDVVFEEFKGTGNMELVLDRNLSEKRVFPAIDIAKSGTRKDDLLLTAEEQDVLDTIHRQLRGLKSDEITEEIIKIFTKTRNNREFLDYCKKIFARR